MKLHLAFGPHLIELTSALEVPLETLRKAWAPGLISPAALLGAAPVLSYSVEKSGRVTKNGELLFQEPRPEAIALRLSADLITSTPYLTNSCWSLHAAGVLLTPDRLDLPAQSANHLIILVGESDAGKSTTTRAALEAGAHYLSDDMIVVDGDSIFGLPRNVQFNSCVYGEPPHPHVARCDLTSYRFLRGDQLCVIPLWPEPHPSVGTLKKSDLEIHVVHVSRGEQDSVTPINELERLRVLYDATLKPTTPAAHAGQWGNRQSFRLIWQNPSTAWALLIEQLRRRLHCDPRNPA